MKFALILAAVLVASSAVPHPRMVQQEWDSFKSTHVKVYENVEEEAKRIAIFHQNLIKIEEHNKLYEQGLSTFKMGVTQFADMSSEEFMAYVNQSAVKGHPQVRGEKVVLSDDTPPDSVDWRTKNVLTPVKDQGDCGSCWSFSVTGALEAAYAVAHGELLSLSEQQLIDCSKSYANLGCKGGWIGKTLDYVHDHSISTEQNYPYKGKDGKCHSAEASPVKVNSYVRLDSYLETIRNGIAKTPLSVSVSATNKWHLYTGGVLEDEECNPFSINHDVLTVGYNSKYWIIKNSWGRSWGEGGYMRLSINSDCGVQDDAILPVVA